jgi:hypothetical protein
MIGLFPRHGGHLDGLELITRGLGFELWDSAAIALIRLASEPWPGFSADCPQEHRKSPMQG